MIAKWRLVKWLASMVPSTLLDSSSSSQLLVLPKIEHLDLDSRIYATELERDFLSVPVGEADLVGWRRYSLKLLPVSDLDDKASDQALSSFSSSRYRRESFQLQDGKVMHCALPPAPNARLDNEAMVPSQDEQDHMIKEATRALTAAVHGAGQQCLVHKEGWWTYEYCHQKRIRQLHVYTAADRAAAAARNRRPAFEVGEVSNEYLLGRFLPKADKAVQVRFGNVFVMNYRDGEQCDAESGAIPRSVQVRFKCSPNRLVPHVISVFESTICHYVVVIGSPSLCSIQSFAKWTRAPETIFCTDPTASEPPADTAADTPIKEEGRKKRRGQRQVWLDRISDLLDGEGVLGTGSLGGLPLLRRALWDLLESEFGSTMAGGLPDPFLADAVPPRQALSDLFAELAAQEALQNGNAKGQSPARRKGKVIIASVEDEDASKAESKESSDDQDQSDKGEREKSPKRVKKREFSFEF